MAIIFLVKKRYLQNNLESKKFLKMNIYCRYMGGVISTSSRRVGTAASNAARRQSVSHETKSSTSQEVIADICSLFGSKGSSEIESGFAQPTSTTPLSESSSVESALHNASKSNDQNGNGNNDKNGDSFKGDGETLGMQFTTGDKLIAAGVVLEGAK